MSARVSISMGLLGVIHEPASLRGWLLEELSPNARAPKDWPVVGRQHGWLHDSAAIDEYARKRTALVRWIRSSSTVVAVGIRVVHKPDSQQSREVT